MPLPTITTFETPEDCLAAIAGASLLINPKLGRLIGRYIQAQKDAANGTPPDDFIDRLNRILDHIDWYDMREHGWFTQPGGLIKMADDRRLDLDAMDKREEELKRDELKDLGLDPDAPRALAKTDESSELVKLRAENEKMRAMINRVLEARRAATEFMTIWSDPRKLPELIQEVYNSHPDVVKLREDRDLAPEYAMRGARLIAHMALTYELHPLISGMIYCWVDGAKLIVEIGYRGYNEMLKRDGLDYSTRPMTDEERRTHGLKDADFGYLCFVEDWERTDRYRARGKADPEPYRGVGIWRAENPLKYGKPDPIPSTKSGDWVSEKNALKDGARRALSFAITKTANADVLDFAYNVEEDAWSLPIQTARWVGQPIMERRFLKLLADNNITEDEINDFIGHNWRHTTLEPEEIKAKVNELIAARDAEGQGLLAEFVGPKPAEEQPAEPATEEKVIEPDKLAEETVKVEDKPAEPLAEIEPEPAKTEEKPAAEPPTKTVKKAKEDTALAVKKCENCKIEDGSDTPEGWLCATCAQNKANARAASEEKKAA